MSEYIIYLRTLCNAFIFPYSKHNNVPTHTDPDPIISQTPASAVLPISHSTPNTLALLMFFKETVKLYSWVLYTGFTLCLECFCPNICMATFSSPSIPCLLSFFQKSLPWSAYFNLLFNSISTPSIHNSPFFSLSFNTFHFLTYYLLLEVLFSVVRH